jgi:hypothetical protein
MFIELTGTGGTNTNLIVPANKKLYFIYNNTSSGQVTVKVAGQTGVSVPNGVKIILVCNGTDVVNATSYINGLSANITTLTAGSATITNLVATSAVITSLTLSNPLGVAQGGTGSTAAPSNGQLLVGNGTGFTLSTLNGGPGVGITNNAGSITITATGTGFIASVNATSPLQSTGTQSITISLASAVPVSLGGTGLTATPTNGQLLIGNGSGYTRSTLTAGTGISITNSAGSITISGTSSLTGITTSTATALGLNAGDSVTTGYDNTCIGYDAGTSITTGYDNTVVGQQAGDSILGGYENTCVGSTSGYGITSGYQNTCLGYGAGDVLTSGNSNVFVGRWTGIDITTGNYNTGVGTVSLANAFINTSNASALGYNAQVSGSNQVQLGNSSTTTYAYGAVQDRSDVRDKTAIRDTQLGLNFIMALRPRDFKWDMREDYRTERPNRKDYASDAEYQAALKAWSEANKLANITHNGTKARTRYHHGLIAQEVKAVADSMGVDFGGYQDHTIKGGDDVKSIGYNELIAPLIKAIQELKAEFDEYKRTHP